MVALAILVILTFALGALITFASWSWKKLELRNPKSETLFEAGVSRFLVPRLDPFIKSGSTLYITGGDGAYAFKPHGRYWLSHLEDWVKRGCTIRYLLCCPDPRSCEMYRGLARNYPERFYLHELNNKMQWSPDASELAKKYATFHPTLLDVGNGGGRAMWIENYHPLDSEYAFDVDFVSPEDGRSDERFNEYLREIEILIKSAPAVKSGSSIEKSAA